MPKYVAKRFLLEGQVQGVGCRAQIYDLVEGIGHISGYVRNLLDGGVELRVKGPDWRVSDLEDILRNRMRPPVRVERLLVEDIQDADVPVTGFVIQRDG
jgi:acylphosphatase